LNENNICFKSNLIDEKLYDLFTKISLIFNMFIEVEITSLQSMRLLAWIFQGGRGEGGGIQ
jgi:hypothetical protein